MRKKLFIIFLIMLFSFMCNAGAVLGDGSENGTPQKLEYNGKPLKVWLEQIRSPKWSESSDAAQAICRIHYPAMPELLELGKKEKGHVLFNIMHAIDMILGSTRQQPDQADLSAVYLNGLNDKSAFVRRAAVRGTNYLRGEERKKLVEKVLKDKDVIVRRNITGYLATKDLSYAPIIIEAMHDEDAGVRSIACNAIGQMKYEKAVPLLQKALEDDSEAVRQSAAFALCNIGDIRAIPDLINASTNMESFVSAQVLKKINEMRFNGSNAEILIDAIKHKNVTVRLFAINKLGEINAKAYLNNFIEALEDKNEDVRYLAASWILRINDASTVPAFIKALKDSDNYVRWISVKALGILGNKSAIPALIDMLKDESIGVCITAGESLSKLAGENFGTDDAKWRAWWDANKSRILKE